MTESSEQINTSRPFFLSILCIAIFVYAGFLTFLFLLSIIFNLWVTNTLLDFLPEKTLSNGLVLIISILGFVVNGISVLGAFYLWRLRKTGFYLFLISNLVFILFPFFIGYGNYYSTVILIVMLLFIALFLKKLN